MGFPKKLLGQDETVVMLLRPHIKRLFLPVLVLLVTAPASAFAAALVPGGSAQQWARGLITLAALLVLLRWTVTPFVIWWNTMYVITNRRLVMRHGVLTRSGHDMPLSRLNDVSFAHNLFDRMIGCGTLTVESAGERGQVVLADIPKVEQVQRVLYRLSDEARPGIPAPFARPGFGFASAAPGEDEGQDDDGYDGGRPEERQGDDAESRAGDPAGDPQGEHPGGDGGRSSRWGRRRR
jgi:membrane protein YdbS with pleckstrin-like domain